MNQAIGESITFAVGVAISPLPIVGVILMLLSKRSGTNSLAFLVGWVAGIAVVLTAVIAVGAALGISGHGSTTTDSTSTFKLVLGIVLIVMGLRRIRRHPAPGEAPEPPKWLASIEGIGPGRAVGLGAVLAAVNPKNLILIIGGGMAIAQTPATTTQKVVAAAIFVVLGASTVAIPVVFYRVARARATPVLEAWRDWMTVHAAATVGAVLLLLGVLLVGKGVGGF